METEGTALAVRFTYVFSIAESQIFLKASTVIEL